MGDDTDKFVLALRHRDNKRCFYSFMEDADYYGTRQFMSCDKLGYAEEFASEEYAVKFKDEHDKGDIFEVLSITDAEEEYDRLLRLGARSDSSK